MIIIHSFNVLGLSAYYFFIILSLIVGLVFIYITLRKKKIEREKIILSFTLMIALTIIGGLLFTMIEKGSIHVYSLSSYGGAIGLIISIITFNIVSSNHHKKDFIETYILSLPLIYSISKLGCFFAGCCHGIEYNGLFSIKYENLLTGSYFPIQITETILFMIIFVLCLYIYNRTKDKKYIIEIVFILCGLCKFLLDYLRISHIGQILSINQIVSLMFIIIGIIIYIVRTRKESIYEKQ